MKELQQLKENKQKLISRLDSWTEDQLSAKESDESWSAKQIVEHILVSEMGTFHYMKKKTSSGWDALEDANEEHRESSNKLNAALTSDKKWKAPPVLPEPVGDAPWEKLKMKWLGMNAPLEQFSTNMPEGAEVKLVSKHPYAGRQTMEQTLGFLAEHITHHHHQIDRLEEFLQKK
ncbi:MAG: DinB family protein [Flavobacteriales bacterium]